jgi:hypothetical protein
VTEAAEVGARLRQAAGRAAIDAFLRWARDFVARDPARWSDIEQALAETTMPPDLRRIVEAELATLADQYGAVKSPKADIRI